jgi:hypothetical protein
MDSQGKHIRDWSRHSAPDTFLLQPCQHFADVPMGENAYGHLRPNVISFVGASDPSLLPGLNCRSSNIAILELLFRTILPIATSAVL